MANAGGGEQSFDVVIVGAGFSGLYGLHRLRALGFSVRVYEAGEGVGGTWFWNRYPGARVDVESMEYCYSFSPELADEWEWSERYASQPELLRYLNHVADRFDLRRDIQLETRITAATFDEAAMRWRLSTNRGEAISARFVVMATGCLSIPKTPEFPGVEAFKGDVYSTSNWPMDGVDLTGKRVGVIGTGSSAIQAIPVIAAQAKHLTVFQRTPNFSMPSNNGPIDPVVAEDWRINRVQYKNEARASGFGIRMVDATTIAAFDVSEEERRKTYEERWGIGGFAIVGAYADLLASKPANDTAVAFVGEKIRSIVKDPAVAELLTPKTYPIATKRLCVDTGYYATFNRPNVSLVDVSKAPVEEITASGLRTGGKDYEFDVIVFAIGFDAMTGALTGIDIKGRGGASLRQKWADGPRTYLGLMVAGFPNLFTITGPGSPSVLCNMAVAIEQHIDWVTECIAWLSDRQVGAIEATDAAQDEWVAHVNEVGDGTLFPLANSWYMGANVPGKARVFMPYIGGFPVYREKCDEVAAKGYEGFTLTSAALA